MMSADDLRFFLEVARTGRLVAAASRLNVDHTTVGRRVTRLERSMGSRLFDRTPAGWELTEAGRHLAVHAEAIESSLQTATEELRSSPGRISGTLRLAAPDGFGAFVLAPGLSMLRTQHPDLTVEIVTATRLNLLATKEFDVGISLEEPAARGVETHGLAHYPLGLYAATEYLAAHGPISSIKELAHHALIGYVDSLLDIPSLKFLDAAIPDARPVIQTNNVTGQWMAAAAGLGVAILPLFVAEPDSRLRRVLSGEVNIERKYWVAVPRELRRLARIRAALTSISSIVADHPHLTLISE